MELRHLKLVYTVAKEGTLTKAAEKLFLTQSALSHHLKEIEGELGTPVFKRSSKRMLLTPIGELVFNSASEVLNKFDELDKEIKRCLNGNTGKIRLSAECYTGFHWLPPIMKNFNSEYPNVDIEIVPKAVSNPIKYLLNGKIDLGVVLRKTTDKRIIYNRLFNDELVAVFSNNHHWKSKNFITADDFKSEHLFIHSRPFESSRLYNYVLKPKNVVPQKVTFLQLTEAVIEMVAAQLGVTVIAKWSATPYLKNKELSYLPVTSKGLKRTWYAACLKEAQLPLYTKKFIELLAEFNSKSEI